MCWYNRHICSCNAKRLSITPLLLYFLWITELKLNALKTQTSWYLYLLDSKQLVRHNAFQNIMCTEEIWFAISVTCLHHSQTCLPEGLLYYKAFFTPHVPTLSLPFFIYIYILTWSHNSSWYMSTPLYHNLQNNYAVSNFISTISHFMVVHC